MALFLTYMIFFLAVFGLSLVFFIYPMSLWLFGLGRRDIAPRQAEVPPSITLLTVVRNGEEIIAAKVRNSMDLDYPPNRLEMIVYSDGSTDRTAENADKAAGDRVRVLASAAHQGKNAGLNAAASVAAGDILVISDADARLERDALRHLVRRFEDASVGGVCGQMVISDEKLQLAEVQRDYWRLDSAIKRMESRLGRLTSNQGKISAVRRALYRPIPPGVTDDMYISLAVVRQGFDFVFEPLARALIRVPSRNPKHEIRRRRRIVGGSLKGIWTMRRLFNPRIYGFYSYGLFVNKVLRRLLPLFLFLIFVSSLILAGRSRLMALLLGAQFLFYAAAAASPLVNRHLAGIKLVKRICTAAYYFCLGNLGTILGWLDFLSGRETVKWQPEKSDGRSAET